MKSEITPKSKKAIENKLFLKFVSFNKSNEEELKKTIALSDFLRDGGERLVQVSDKE